MTQQEHRTDSPFAWHQVRQLTDANARIQVKLIVDRDAQALADLFYHEMQADDDAGKLLDHDLVNRRLRASMAAWLRALFDERTLVEDLIALQRRTGEVHARIGVSNALVSGGARILKRAITRRLLTARAPDGVLAGAVQYVYELIDLAIDTMAASAISSTARLGRSDEAYRLFFLTQNLRAERERQRSHLMQWARNIMMRNYWEVPVDDGPSPQRERHDSHFALWIEHKASMLFENAPELTLIRERIDVIERDLLPRLSDARDSHAESKPIVARLNEEIGRIEALLGAMFDRSTHLEDGRDDVTLLLNRRFFPSIVKREIGLSQVSGVPFSLLMLDVDDFASIAMALGSEGSDALLAQVAAVLGENVRAGDFVFRIGDARFLVLLVEGSADTATTVARALCDHVARMLPRTSTGVAPRLMLSAGVATFDGHPDYQRLVEEAEAALRAAPVRSTA